MVNPFFFMGVSKQTRERNPFCKILSFFKDIQCDYIASHKIKYALEMQ